jgi:hypothetical protein
MAELKPYLVGTPDPEDGCELVWALDEGAAVEAIRRSSYLLTDAADADLRVEAQDPFPGTEPEAGASPVEARTWVLREYGLGFVDDKSCACCELPTMGDEFPLCEDCEQCDDCGHDEGCSHAEDDDGLYLYDEASAEGGESDADDDLPPEAGT